jgi:hypothetical protein
MSETEEQNFQSQFLTKAITKAWRDPKYRERLKSDPRAALSEAGVTMSVPAGLEIKVVEDTTNLMHLILPPPPSDGELSDKDLALIAAGTYLNARLDFFQLAQHTAPVLSTTLKP